MLNAFFFFVSSNFIAMNICYLDNQKKQKKHIYELFYFGKVKNATMFSFCFRVLSSASWLPLLMDSIHLKGYNLKDVCF